MVDSAPEQNVTPLAQRASVAIKSHLAQSGANTEAPSQDLLTQIISGLSQETRSLFVTRDAIQALNEHTQNLTQHQEIIVNRVRDQAQVQLNHSAEMEVVQTVQLDRASSRPIQKLYVQVEHNDANYSRVIRSTGVTIQHTEDNYALVVRPTRTLSESIEEGAQSRSQSLIEMNIGAEGVDPIRRVASSLDLADTQLQASHHLSGSNDTLLSSDHIAAMAIGSRVRLAQEADPQRPLTDLAARAATGRAISPREAGYAQITLSGSTNTDEAGSVTAAPGQALRSIQRERVYETILPERLEPTRVTLPETPDAAVQGRSSDLRSSARDVSRLQGPTSDTYEEIGAALAQARDITVVRASSSDRRRPAVNVSNAYSISNEFSDDDIGAFQSVLEARLRAQEALSQQVQTSELIEEGGGYATVGPRRSEESVPAQGNEALRSRTMASEARDRRPPAPLPIDAEDDAPASRPTDRGNVGDSEAPASMAAQNQEKVLSRFDRVKGTLARIRSGENLSQSTQIRIQRFLSISGAIMCVVGVVTCLLGVANSVYAMVKIWQNKNASLLDKVLTTAQSSLSLVTSAFGLVNCVVGFVSLTRGLSQNLLGSVMSVVGNVMGIFTSLVTIGISIYRAVNSKNHEERTAAALAAFDASVQLVINIVGMVVQFVFGPVGYVVNVLLQIAASFIPSTAAIYSTIKLHEKMSLAKFKETYRDYEILHFYYYFSALSATPLVSLISNLVQDSAFNTFKERFTADWMFNALYERLRYTMPRSLQLAQQAANMASNMASRDADTAALPTDAKLEAADTSPLGRLVSISMAFESANWVDEQFEVTAALTTVQTATVQAFLAPQLVTAGVNGNTLILSFDIRLIEVEGKYASPDQFVVKVTHKGGRTETVQVKQVSVEGNQVRLSLGIAVLSTDTAVTVSYTDPSSGNDRMALQSREGIDVASFSNPVRVTNYTDNATVRASYIWQDSPIKGKHRDSTIWDKNGSYEGAWNQSDLIESYKIGYVVSATLNGDSVVVRFDRSINETLRTYLTDSDSLAHFSVRNWNEHNRLEKLDFLSVTDCSIADNVAIFQLSRWIDRTDGDYLVFLMPTLAESGWQFHDLLAGGARGELGFKNSPSSRDEFYDNEFQVVYAPKLTEITPITTASFPQSVSYKNYRRVVSEEKVEVVHNQLAINDWYSTETKEWTQATWDQVTRAWAVDKASALKLAQAQAKGLWRQITLNTATGQTDAYTINRALGNYDTVELDLGTSLGTSLVTDLGGGNIVYFGQGETRLTVARDLLKTDWVVVQSPNRMTRNTVELTASQSDSDVSIEKRTVDLDRILHARQTLSDSAYVKVLGTRLGNDIVIGTAANQTYFAQTSYANIHLYGRNAVVYVGAGSNVKLEGLNSRVLLSMDEWRLLGELRPTTPGRIEGAYGSGALLDMSYTGTNANYAGGMDMRLRMVGLPTVSDFLVKVNGQRLAVDRITLSGQSLGLTLAGSVAANDIVTVSYYDDSMDSDEELGHESRGLLDTRGQALVTMIDQGVVNLTGDQRTPTLIKAVVRSGALNLRFDQVIDDLRLPLSTMFQLRRNRLGGLASTEDYVPIMGVAADPDGRGLTLTLSQPAQVGDSYVLAYWGGSNSDQEYALQSLAGVDSGNWAGVWVVNATDDHVGPTMRSHSDAYDRAFVSGTSIRIRFNESLDPNVLPLASQFRITSGGRPIGVSHVSVMDDVLCLELDSGVAAGEEVLLSLVSRSEIYGQEIGAADLSDLAGNRSALVVVDPDLNGCLPVVNLTGSDQSSPALITATTNIDGSRVMLIFSEALASEIAYKPEDFILTSGTHLLEINAVSRTNDPKQLWLDLSPSATKRLDNESSLLLSYNPINFETALQDDQNNLVSAINAASVINQIRDRNALKMTSASIAGNLVQVNFNQDILDDRIAPLEAFVISETTLEGRVERRTVLKIEPQTLQPNSIVMYLDRAVSVYSEIKLNYVPSLPEKSPEVLRASLDGQELKIQFSGRLMESLFSLPAGSGPSSPWSVAIEGQVVAIQSVRVLGDIVTLQLSSSALAGQNFSVRYMDPSAEDDAVALQSVYGEDVSDFHLSSSIGNHALPVINVSGSTQLVVVSATANAALLVIQTNQELYTPALGESGPDRAQAQMAYNQFLESNREAFSVVVDGVALTPTSLSINGSAISLSLPVTITDTSNVLLNYALPVLASEAIRDTGGTQRLNGFNSLLVSNVTISHQNLSDQSGNPLQAVQNFEVDNRSSGDVSAPTYQGGWAQDKRITLQYDSLLRVNAQTLPDAAQFSVQIDGKKAKPKQIVAIGNLLFLELEEAIKPHQRVQVSYTDATRFDDKLAIQDMVGNDASSLQPIDVRNITADTQAPVLMAASMDGARLSLSFSEELISEAAPGDGESPAIHTAPSKNAFVVKVNGETRSVRSIDIGGALLTLELDQAVSVGDKVTVSYQDPNAEDNRYALQDNEGNDVESFSDIDVLNQTGFLGLFNATANGAQLTLTFNQLLSSEGLPEASDIKVLVSRARAEIADAKVMTRVNGQDQAVRAATFEAASYSYQALHLQRAQSESIQFGTVYVSGALTLQAWFMPEVHVAEGQALTASTLFSLKDGINDANSIGVQMDEAGRVKVSVKVDGQTVAEAISQDALLKANQWSFVSLVVNDHNQLELWVNGQRAPWDRLQSVWNLSRSVPIVARTLWVGNPSPDDSSYTSREGFFNGFVRDVRLYDAANEDARILSDFLGASAQDNDPALRLAYGLDRASALSPGQSTGYQNGLLLNPVRDATIEQFQAKLQLSSEVKAGDEVDLFYSPSTVETLLFPARLRAEGGAQTPALEAGGMAVMR